MFLAHHKLIYKMLVYVISVFFHPLLANSIELNSVSEWIAQHDVSVLQKEGKGFSFQCTGSDPYILSHPLEIAALDNLAIEIVMKVTKGSQAQLFWSSSKFPTITEQNSQRFSIHADGRFHTYLIPLSNHPRWSGNITRLRLDPTDQPAEITVQSFKLLTHAGPNMLISSPIISNPRLNPNQTVAVKVDVTNSGDSSGTVQASLHFPPGAPLQHQPETRNITLSPQQNETLHWDVVFTAAWAGHIVCEWNLLDDTHQSFPPTGTTQTMMQVNQPDTEKQSISLRSGNAFIEVQHTGLGFGSLEFSLQDQDTMNPMAWMPRLGSVAAQMDDGHSDVWAVFSKEIETVSENRIRLSKGWIDRDQRKWKFSLDIQPHQALSGAFHFQYQLSCSNMGKSAAKLIHFSGPELLAGEGSYGSKKDQAIFPGVEYLGKEDVSSSHDVAHPPVRDQYMPHPSKVTVPFMSLSHENHLIALMWDNSQGWNRQHELLSPKFASPNRLQKQDNHLMSLFVPNVPDYTMENKEYAHQPYEMKENEPVTIECVIYLAQDKTALDAVYAWLSVYQNGTITDVMPEPRSYQETIELSRRAYFESCWDETKMGWGHCAGWDPQPSGGFLALLDLDFLFTHDEDAALRVKNVKQHILETHGESSLGDARGCHVMTLEPGFYWGVMEHKLGEWMNRISAYSNEQNTDGSWGFHPGSDEQTNLGKDGQVTSGTIAQKAAFILKYARIAANPKATEIGLKALEALNRFVVPHGAQGWECPLASPDILASAYCAQANLDAFLITGQQEYLDKAVYWAKTGVVFHYLWNHDDTPLQRYATIPIFGATFYSHNWRGVPVQWCGLVYAYTLLQLTEYDRTMDWKQLATGIVNSAMIQQMTDGEYAGTLPDSFSGYFKTPMPAYINPENILTNLHELKGNGFSIHTMFAETPSPDALRISGIGKIEDVMNDSESLSFTFHPKHNRDSEILIAPIHKKPSSIVAGESQTIEEASNLYGKEWGWKYIEEHKALLVHVYSDIVKIKIDL